MWIKDLNTVTKTIKLPEENRTTLPDTDLGNNFSGYDTKSTGNKSKNQPVDLRQTKSLLLHKGNKQQSEKPTSKMGENICKTYLIED